jgi:N-acetylmuramoyl-L-alanine amidase
VSVRENNLFMKNLRKLGYTNTSTFIKNKSNFNKLLIKAFQRRFRPELINGKIDEECLLIINKLVRIKV